MTPTGTRPLLGISLQADEHFLALNRELIEDAAEIYEINPECLWEAGCEPSPMYGLFRDIVARSGRPVVGHGILYSLGAVTEPPRRPTWLRALRRDQAAFGFEWFSEHLGFADDGERHLALPLPLPAGDDTVATVAVNFAPLKDIFTTVAFENNVGYFALGDPLDEVDMFRAVCDRADCSMVLDLHNAYTTCMNFGIGLQAWLDRVPWKSVIEIHLSGGSLSDPSWFDCPRPFRLDTHDHPVPEPVFQIFAESLERCPNLRAVIIEWLPEGMDQAAANSYAADFERARRILCR